LYEKNCGGPQVVRSLSKISNYTSGCDQKRSLGLHLPKIYEFPGIFVTMTVDNRGQDDEEVGQPQLQRQNSKGEIKECDGSNLQATPIEKVRQQ